MNRWLYNALWYLASPLIAGYLLVRSRKQPEYRQHWGERWGFYTHATRRMHAPLIWVHAVSVGETQAAQPLIEALLHTYPTCQILLTYMTPTGRATGARVFGQRFDERVVQAYLAYDYPGATARFFKYFKPDLGIVLETEIWPNLLQQAQRKKIPVALVNARLSEKSARKAERWKNLMPQVMHEALQSLQLIAAQTPADAERLKILGATQVEVTGNMKFDVQPDQTLSQLGAQWRAASGAASVLLAASTREGEEALILDQLAQLDASTLLVLVPRHPQRFEEVAQLLLQRNIPFQRRSQWDGKSRLTENTRVLLGDSMGEMPAYYAFCDVAFVGGSLVPLGGQNLIEACALGKPVLIGPHTFNFTQASEQAVIANAARRVEDAAMLMAQANRILQSPQKQHSMASAALQFSQQHRGATQRTLQLLIPLLGPVNN